MTIRLALLAAALTIVAATPARAAVPPLPDPQCPGCVQPTNQPPPGGFNPSTGGGPTPQQRNAFATGSKARAQNFLYGPLAKDQFDPSGYQAIYLQDEDKLKVFGVITVATVPNIGDKVWGEIAAWWFAAYKGIVTFTINVVGVLSFGLAFIVAMLDPALRMGENFQRRLVTPFGLASIAMVCAAGYAAYAYAWKGRLTHATGELLASAAAAALIVLIPFGFAIRYLLNLAAGASAVILTVGTGGDPSSIPGPTAGPVRTKALMDAYHQFTSGLLDTMIGKVCEILVFGTTLPRECEGAYRATVAKHLSTTDPENFTALQAIPACRGFVEHAVQPDVDRAFYAFCLGFFYAVPFAVVYFLMGWPSIRGTIRVVVTAATGKLVLISVALPGPWRAAGVRFLLMLLMGLLALVIYSVLLVVTLVGMNGVLRIPAGTPVIGSIYARLVLALLVPAAMLGLAARRQRAEKRWVREQTRHVAGRTPEREKPVAPRAERIARQTRSRVERQYRSVRRDTTRSPGTPRQEPGTADRERTPPHTPAERSRPRQPAPAVGRGGQRGASHAPRPVGSPRQPAPRKRSRKQRQPS